VPVGTGPWGVAVSSDGTKAYVANFFSNTTSVINTTDNTVIAKVPVGISPSGVAVSPDGTKVYVVNADGTVSIIDTTKNIVTAAVKVGKAPLVIGQFIGKGSAK
jgi:YVTN family beta-propeller protein